MNKKSGGLNGLILSWKPKPSISKLEVLQSESVCYKEKIIAKQLYLEYFGN